MQYYRITDCAALLGRGNGAWLSDLSLAWRNSGVGFRPLIAVA
jgi:hypothetical protein